MCPKMCISVLHAWISKTGSLFVYRLHKNYELLKSRLNQIIESKKMLEVDLKQRALYNRTLISDMNSLKPEIKRLYKLREQFKK